MAIDAKKVLVGAPDQSTTTGAVNFAPIGTTLPTDATTALDNAFSKCGYVSEDGITLSQNYSTTDIHDWSRATVRTMVRAGLPVRPTRMRRASCRSRAMGPSSLIQPRSLPASLPATTAR